MPISSITFMFVFFPVVLMAYFLLSFSRPLQNFWLFLASVAYYALGQAYFVIPLLLIVLISWLLGLLISKSPPKAAKALLILACCAIAGNLFVLRYAGAIWGIVGQTIGLDLALDSLLSKAPLGVAFYTLNALAYCIEVYRGAGPEKNPAYVGLYIAFFPNIIAGPIPRYRQFLNEIRNRRHSVDACSQGVCRFAAGFVKVQLLAHQIATIADLVFDWSAMGRFDAELTVTAAWLGLIAYALQIYLELSAYADMAIGIGQIFGFSLPENFNQPYSASSVTDFWRRWNITLTAWFREYIYTPMGGGKLTNKDTVIRNLLIVWILIGLWHGNSIVNILFGVWFFVLMLAEHFLEIKNKDNFGFLRHFYTMLAFMAGCVLLRTENIYQAGRFFMNLSGTNFNAFHSGLTTVLLRENMLWLLLGLLFSTPLIHTLYRRLQEHNAKTAVSVCNLLYPIVLGCALLISLVYMTQGTYEALPYQS